MPKYTMTKQDKETLRYPGMAFIVLLVASIILTEMGVIQ